MPPKKMITASAPPSRLAKAGRTALVGAALAAAGALAGCKSPSSTEGTAPAGPRTMNTPMGNMRLGMPQTLPVETTPPTGATTAPHPPTVMGTESREPAVAVPSTTAPTTPAAAAPAAPAFAPSHVLTADEPYFSEPPAAGVNPSGTLKTGTKVLVVIPGATYSQVTTSEGMTVYTTTDGLKPVGEK